MKKCKKIVVLVMILSLVMLQGTPVFAGDVIDVFIEGPDAPYIPYDFPSKTIYQAVYQVNGVDHSEEIDDWEWYLEIMGTPIDQIEMEHGVDFGVNIDYSTGEFWTQPDAMMDYFTIRAFSPKLGRDLTKDIQSMYISPENKIDPIADIKVDGLEASLPKVDVRDYDTGEIVEGKKVKYTCDALSEYATFNSSDRRVDFNKNTPVGEYEVTVYLEDHSAYTKKFKIIIGNYSIDLSPDYIELVKDGTDLDFAVDFPEGIVVDDEGNPIDLEYRPEIPEDDILLDNILGETEKGFILDKDIPLGNYTMLFRISEKELVRKAFKIIVRNPSITYTAGEGGSITGTTTQIVVPNESGTEVTAVPDDGYRFSQWSDGVTTASRTEKNVTNDVNVTAEFIVGSTVDSSVVTIDTAWEGELKSEVENILSGNPLTDIKTLTITAGELTDADVMWISKNLINLEILNITGTATFEDNVLPNFSFSNNSYHTVDTKLSKLKNVTIDIDDNTSLTFGIGAFYNCTSLTSVNIPEATTFGDSAFFECTALPSISLPKARTFGQQAFAYCSVLTSVNLPNAETFGNNAFGACDRLQSIDLPKAITFGDNAFVYCEALTSVSLPEATTFGKYAFRVCKALPSLSLPKAETFGYYAFSECRALTSISLPAVKKFAYGTFADCYKSITMTLGAIPPDADSSDVFVIYMSDDTTPTSPIIIVPDDAVDAYKASAGWSDDLWYGWSLSTTSDTPETYTVTFLDHDGSILKTETVEHDSSATAPVDPIREGYAFTGWDVAFSNITEDLTVTAQYSINQYEVSFNSNGGSLVAPITANYNSTITEPATPTKEGYSFAGWYQEEELTNEWNFESDTVPAEDITLSAKWVTTQESITMTASPNRVEISNHFNQIFDLSVENDTVIKEVYAEDLSLSGVLSSLNIGEVKNTSKTVTASVYGTLSNAGIGTITLNADKLATTTRPLSADITVVATKPIYTVTFKDYDDSVLKTEKVEYGKHATAPDDPTRNGYTFTGWDTSFTNVTSDLIVTAAYRKNSSGSSSNRDQTTETAENGAAVVVNGKKQTAGTEVVKEENGEKTVELSVNTEILSKKIDEVLKENEASGKTTENVVEILVTTKDTNNIKSILTGDMVKKMEENSFTLSVNTDGIDYIIPAKEIDIQQVAMNLGIKPEDLKEIEVEVQIEKVNKSITKEMMDKANTSGYDLIFPPVKFTIIAKADTDRDNEIEVSKFSSYVQRVMEIPEEIDPDKITTGIVYNPDGTFSHIPTSVFKKNGKWYAKLNSLTNSSYSVIWNPITVKSVEKHWSKKYVNDMASRLVIKNPETFIPDENITRSYFAEYITKALGLYRTGVAKTAKFSDIPLSHHASDAITIAAEYGIINGYPDGTFRPDSKISREEAMVMYAKAMAIAGLKEEANNKIENYTDKEQIATWAFEAVKKTVSAGVFNGKTNTTIDPKGNFTYAEAATAIRNLLTETGLIDK